MRTGIGVLLGVAMTLGVAWAQKPDDKSLLNFTFEEDVQGWMTIGEGGKVAQTKEEGQAKNGKGALKFDYAIEKGKAVALMLPSGENTLAKMQSLRFWVRADHTTTLIVSLQEKEGGRYSAIFSTPGDRWQQVELTPSDFTLGQDPNEPKDPNNKLDMDKVEGIGIADWGFFLAAMEETPISQFFNHKLRKGDHTLLLDDLVASTEPIADDKAEKAAGGEVILDSFTRPQVSWITIGDSTVSHATGKAYKSKALKAEYHQTPGKLFGMIRSLSAAKLKGKESLILSLAASKPTRLIIQLEERGGGKYKIDTAIPGESEATEVIRSFKDFQAAEDSKDDNNTLDLDQITSLVLVDVSGVVDQADQDNTLWVGALKTK